MKYTGENPNSINRIASGSVAINVESIDVTTLTTSGLQISGTLNVSQSISASNVTVGTPTNKPWGEDLAGSIFDFYNDSTPVSTILRVVAGFLSASLPAPTPNTRVYNTVTSIPSNTGVGTVSSYAPGYLPDGFQSSGKTGVDDLVYLYNKGFAKTGSTLFSDLLYGHSNIYIQNYTLAYSSSAANATVASSSLGAQAFGLGTLNTQVFSSGSFTFNYSDNNTLDNITTTSASQHLYSRVGPGNETNSGLRIGTIVTSNPTVILNEFQDGYFTNGFSRALFNGGNNIDGRSQTSISSSGYYFFTASIGISSSKEPGFTTKTTQRNIFWAPVNLLSIENNTVTVTPTSQPLTVTSRSLSGAPYLNSATYGYEVRVDGLFDPMYTGDTNIATSTIAAGSGYISYTTQNANISSSGEINTAGVFFDNAGAGAARATGIVPFRTDMVRFSVTASSNFGTTSNITSTGITNNTFTLRTSGKNKAGTTVTTQDTAVPIFTAGTFGQPAASGSMAYFGRTQGTDPSTNVTESFYGETYRRQVSASGFDVLTFTAPNWDTSHIEYNLPEKELQVKPGFLVRPSGSYGYWIPDPNPSDVFKYYVREVTCGVTAPNNIVFNLTSGGSGVTLVDWENILTDGIAIGIMFQSSTAAALLGSTARFFNLSKGGGVGGGYPVGSTQNPFASDLVIYNEGGGSSGIYTMPVTNGKGMILNGSTLTQYYVVVRYRTDPQPLSQIRISYT